MNKNDEKRIREIIREELGTTKPSLSESAWSDPNFTTGIITGIVLAVGLTTAFVVELKGRAREKFAKLVAQKSKEKGGVAFTKEELEAIKKEAQSQAMQGFSKAAGGLDTPGGLT